MKIGIIGGGNMGAAIINGIYKKNRVFVCEKDAKRSALLRKKFKVKTGDLIGLVKFSDVIILAVKPQDMEALLSVLSRLMTKKAVIVSIAAGITTTFIEKRLRGKPKVIRTMPNMPAQIGEGITAVSKGKYASSKDVSAAFKIFDSVGKTVVVKENLIDAVTAVSGSGPAYVFLFSECMMKAAKALGLSCALSAQLVESTLSGSVHQLTRLNTDAATLRAKVTSKGGTTQAAMDVFFAKKIDKIFIEALKAAKKRAGELSKK